MIRLPVPLLALSWLAISALPATAAEMAPVFQPVGVWRFHHTDGTPFIARLRPDQTATTDWGGGEHGIWRWEGNRVRLYYTDGWDDVLYLRDGRFRKSGYSPEADRCSAPSNDTEAEKLDERPDTNP